MFSSNTSQVSGGAATYIEDVFQTWLYTGNGTTNPIVNGIDLAGKGGLVWIKARTGTRNHRLVDTARGAGNFLSSDTTSAQTFGPTLTSFNSTGFTLASGDAGSNGIEPYVSWTFREQPKFFDVVTYTGTGSARTVEHNLGSEPGCIIVKKTNAGGTNWTVYHRSIGNTKALRLNTTEAETSSAVFWNNTTPTSTNFTVNTNSGVNESGESYVAYLFAHDAGGFGLSGTDNVISCESFTTDGSGNATVNLGYEPQWLTMKSTTASSSWWQVNNMAGYVASPSTTTRYLTFNTPDAEQGWGSVMAPTATGFVATGLLGSTTYIYIAIRRGPMKVPTTGTSVFTPATRTGTGTTATITGVGFPPDVVLSNSRTYAAGYIGQFWDKLRGAGRFLRTPDTAAEGTVANAGVLGQNGYTVSGARGGQNDNAEPFVDYSFLRAPGFFDEVCYTGNRAGRTLNHNLGVAPEMMIVKDRTVGEGWRVYHAALGASGFLVLETVSSSSTDTNIWNNTTPTASVFSVGNYGPVNETGDNFVAYLFASAPGVSKVGSFTGTGATQVINCGFTGGARFVLIKATSTTGNWYFWDTARGMIPSNDPYLTLNDPNPEVTGTDWVDTAATGFELSNAGGNLANSNGVSYIFLAIA